MPGPGILFDGLIRLLPAAALFSLFFVMEGNLRWLGLLGMVPLLMATQTGCPTCDPRARARGDGSGWHPGPGH